MLGFSPNPKLLWSMQVPPGKKSPLPFAASVIPPMILAISYPDIFFKALDNAGTYGVLLLFGFVPPIMAWSERCAKNFALSRSYPRAGFKHPPRALTNHLSPKKAS